MKQMTKGAIRLSSHTHKQARTSKRTFTLEHTYLYLLSHITLSLQVLSCLPAAKAHQCVFGIILQMNQMREEARRREQQYQEQITSFTSQPAAMDAEASIDEAAMEVQAMVDEYRNSERFRVFRTECERKLKEQVDLVQHVSARPDYPPNHQPTNHPPPHTRTLTHTHTHTQLERHLDIGRSALRTLHVDTEGIYVNAPIFVLGCAARWAADT
jgi:hypothetical protein